MTEEESNVHDSVVSAMGSLNDKVDGLQDMAGDFAEGVAQKAQAVADVAAKHAPKISKTLNILLKILGWAFLLYGIFYFVGALVIIIAEIFSAKVGILGGLLSDVGITQFTFILFCVQILLLLVSSALSVVVGRALIKDNRRRVATLTPWMLLCSVISLAVSYMLSGAGAMSVSDLVNVILLLVLSVAIDPSLADERRKKRAADVAEDQQAAAQGMLGRDMTGKGYMRIDFFNCFWIFFVCCILGLLLEIVWHMVVVDPGVYQDRAGLLYGPFSPIYGFGAVLISMALNRMYNKNLVLTFVVAGFVGAAFEVLTAVFMKSGFGVTAWDYSAYTLFGYPDPIAAVTGGRTCTMFFCMWGILGLVWVHFIMPGMLKLINAMPWKLRYSLTSVVAVLMLADCLLTLGSFDCWYERSCGVEPTTPIEQFYADKFDNEWMENRFQSMTMNTEDATRTDTADKLEDASASNSADDGAGDADASATADGAAATSLAASAAAYSAKSA